MPRRRQRKTNWRRQDERLLRVRGMRRGAPDTRKLSRAFVNLAMARAEAAARAQTSAPVAEPDKGDGSRQGDLSDGAV